MPAFICLTCGTQFAPTPSAPERCAICDDERQYIGAGGQRWSTLDLLRASHFTTWREEEAGLIGLSSAPSIGIGQRALLLQTPSGNVLWDCITLLDRSTITAIRALGGLAAIAISHPHYYTTMAEWAEAFDCPVYLHAADRAHVKRPSDRLEFWDGDSKPLLDHLTLIRAGGHFPGGTMLHWPDGANGGGVLMSGDIFQVTPDSKMSFMWSYPNFLPLSAATVQRMADCVVPYRFDRVYGAFFGRIVPNNAKTITMESAARYIKAVNTDRP